MKLSRASRLIAAALAVVAALGVAHAQAPPTTSTTASAPAPSTAAPRASSAPAASAAPSGSAAAGDLPPGHPELPPGHPPTDPALPPGHPPTGSEMPPGHPPADPGQQSFYRPQPDEVDVDESLPPGTVDVLILDADQQPVANAPITLGILKNSVVKGESREEQTAVANERGRHRFTGLETGGGISYRVSTSRGPAEFVAEPFGLRDKGGIRVLLHVYDPVTKLEHASVFMQTIVVLELKQESVAINQLVDIINVGRTAFVPDDVTVKLPASFSAFTTEEGMTSATIAERNGSAQLKGTFPPGQTQLTFRYQLELETSTEQKVTVPLLPRMVAAQVQIGAGPQMGMSVEGFPEAKRTQRRDGRRVLLTEKRLDPNDALTLSVMLRGVPGPGNGRLIAVGLALCAAAAGAFALQRGRAREGLSTDQRDDLVEARDALLTELAELERMRLAGEVGPRTHERIRNAVLDALARIVDRLETVAASVEAAAPDRRSPDGRSPDGRSPDSRSPDDRGSDADDTGSDADEPGRPGGALPGQPRDGKRRAGSSTKRDSRASGKAGRPRAGRPRTARLP